MDLAGAAIRYTEHVEQLLAETGTAHLLVPLVSNLLACGRAFGSMSFATGSLRFVAR